MTIINIIERERDYRDNYTIIDYLEMMREYRNNGGFV
jgi:hypothetical protein